MKKRQILIILFLLMGSLIGYQFWLDKKNSKNIDQHVAAWRQDMASLIPIGTRKEVILAWAKAHSITFPTLDDNHIGYTNENGITNLNANIEQIPVKGIKFPCSAWNIIIDIDLDKQGQSIDQKIYSALVSDET